jgi:hypothetical protein
MPGFVDVSGMTSEQVRRMGQADDDYQAQTWRPKAKPVSVSYSVDDVWAAACAAQRANGGYYKESTYLWDESTHANKLDKRRNRDIMMDFLCVPGTISDEDRAQGQECRKFLQNELTLRALKGQLSGFDASVVKTVAVENQFDSVKHKLELAVVACLPQSHQRAVERQAMQDRVRQSAGVFGAVGDKVVLDVEVVSATYSKIYNIFWITAATPDNHVVFFSNKEKFDTGTHLSVRGTIKAHRDGRTQLNRVKVV